MYKIIQQDKTIGCWHFFFEAWLFAILLDDILYLKIVGPDGSWIIEPKKSN